MKHYQILILLAVLTFGLVWVGCDSKSETPAEESQPAAETVRPMEEYRQEAAEEIDEDNAEEQLDKLEKEIDTELGTQ